MRPEAAGTGGSPAGRAARAGGAAPFVELAGVCRGFDADGRRVEILHDVDLTIAEGEFVAIVGFSGSGKTTLISLMAGLLAADAGTITVGGLPVTGPATDRGVVFQNYSLLPWLTVLGNVLLAVDQAYPGDPAAKRRRRALHFVDLVNLGAAVAKRPGELSGGMRQRVAVARALAMNPRILLLDEPLSALDALTRANLQDEIEHLWARDRKTVVLVTNSVDEGILLADRIVPLTPGPRATLGPSFPVDLPRPRDRAAVNHDPAFRQIRNDVTRYLIEVGSRRQSPAATRWRELPDVAPADVGPHRVAGRV
jgi:nitrate/nitrite transport system ATP-binding protein